MQTAESSVTTILERYLRIRKRTEQLCQSLETEDYIPQPVIDVSPPKWHLAHTTWFFESFVLVPHAPGYKVFHERYGFLFNSYYESVGERVARPNRGYLSRPTVAEVYQYRAHVNAGMEAFLSAHEPSASLAEVIELGCQHEQQHQELLIYDLKYILGENPLDPAYTSWENHAASETRPAGWLHMDAGLYTIGHQADGFAFDNELGVHRVYLHPYRIMDRLVTAGEFLEFMNAGGYTDFQYWLSEGWAWVQANNVNAPRYWYERDGAWHYFTTAGDVAVNPNEPVTHISFFEADAYARWKGLRLPTEFEWEAACRTHQPNVPSEAHFQDGDRFHPVSPAQGNYQFYGDCWEWTNSAYLPYPYFTKAEGAIGEYNGKFMINQMVLRGGSVATPRDHIRPSYRNFFHPHLRWQFTGIRLAESLPQ